VTTKQLKEQNFHLESEEVQSLAWISKEIAKKALETDKEHLEKFKCLVCHEKQQIEKEIEIKLLQSLNLTHENIHGMSRITTATAFILHLWVNE
jgi:hypothetical protein